MSSPFAPRTYGEIHKVSDSVYIFRNITNSSFVIGERSVAVIDTQVNLSTAKRLLELIRSVTDKPIHYVINTHYHWDHTNGNVLFQKQGAEVISSQLTKEFMVRRAPRQKEFLAGRGFELGEDPLLPEVTFEGEYAMDLGNMPLRLFHAGSAETDDATAVHVVRENILMSGDTIMTGSFPIFGQPVWDEGLQGDDAWIKTVRSLMALKPARIVPGHGPLAGDAEVETFLRIQRFFTEEVKRLVDRGYGLDEVLRDLEPRLPKWILEIPIVWGTPRYAILRVFRGLTRSDKDKEPGWQCLKPSAISYANTALVGAMRASPLQEKPEDFLQMASEAAEGGDSPLGLTILKKASGLFPASGVILCAYAEALIEASRAEASVLEKGDFFQIARRCWDKALEMNPQDTSALLGEGRYLTMMAYRGGDNPRPGMALLEKVVASKPGGRVQAEAEFYLGMGYRRLGNESQARSQFQKALTFDPSFMPAQLAQL